MNLEFLEIASVALLPRNDGILEFPKIKIPPNPQKTKIPYRDPRVKPEDDTRQGGILDGSLNEIASLRSH